MNEQTTIHPDTLRPLPIRVAQRQYLRLVAHRAGGGLSVQEHIRRAIDEYLDNLDLKRMHQRLVSAETSTSHAEGAGASGAEAASPAGAALEDPAAVGATPVTQPPSAAAGDKQVKPKTKSSSTPGRAKASKHVEKKLVYR